MIILKQVLINKDTGRIKELFSIKILYLIDNFFKIKKKIKIFFFILNFILILILILGLFFFLFFKFLLILFNIMVKFTYNLLNNFILIY